MTKAFKFQVVIETKTHDAIDVDMVRSQLIETVIMDSDTNATIADVDLGQQIKYQNDESYFAEQFNKTNNVQIGDCNAIWTLINSLESKLSKADYDNLCDTFCDFEGQWAEHSNSTHSS